MSKTALIVDDSRSARIVLKRVLETNHLNVDTSESAEDAIDYLIDNRPDVIFMDHQMPGMDGFEAVSAIKNNPDTATIPIMMYTSQKGELYVGQARALGAVGVLPKEVAPVEVSNVLKSLHVIGDEKKEQSEKQTPPIQDSSDRLAEIEPQDLIILLQDLFEQQQTVIRRDLLDGYDTLATRIARENQPLSPIKPDQLPAPDEGRSSGLQRTAVMLLAVFAMITTWFYWKTEQSLGDMKAQNTEFQRVLESQRISIEEELQRTLESQRISAEEDSLQVLQQVDDYQQSLDTMNAVTISSLEWGANQAANYHFGDLPLGDERLAIVEQLTNFLSTIDFSGVVSIETHVANFCLTIAGSDGYAPAEDGLASDCDRIGVSQGEAFETGLGQSVGFANFTRLAEQRSGGRIRYEIVSRGNSDPLMDYPASTDGVSASAWNRIAGMNNRVMISVFPNSD